MLRHTLRIASYLAAFVAWSLLSAPMAHAYIDPGSGSYIIQILVGVAAGAGLAIATFWRRIVVFFSKRFGRDKGAA